MLVFRVLDRCAFHVIMMIINECKLLDPVLLALLSWLALLAFLGIIINLICSCGVSTICPFVYMISDVK